MVRALLAVAGVDINQAEEDGVAPLMMAKYGGHQAIVALLEVIAKHETNGECDERCILTNSLQNMFKHLSSNTCRAC